MFIKWIIISYVFVYYVQFVSSFVLPYEGLYRLDIIHYNDFHARFEETTDVSPVCRFNDDCLGGFPRLYTAIISLKNRKPQSILLNAGDSFQGTYWYTLLKWKVTQDFLNLLPHDAHVIGNHDFDDGPKGLAPYISALNAPVVVANMDSKHERILKDLYKPYIILERNGRKIGVIGLITPDTKTLSFTGNVEFTDPHEATRREAQKLTELGVDIIVLLSHCGYEVDVALAREHGQYIDVVVGGHSHRDQTLPTPYMTIVEADSDKKKQVIVVQAFAFTKAVGDLSVYFDINGNVVKWDGEQIYLNNSVKEDMEIKDKLESYAKLVHEAENIPIGSTKSELDYRACAHGECKLGNLLVDALNHWAKRIFNRKDAHISFVQRSNIIAVIPQGLITKGMMIDLFPYYDYVQSFEMEGRYILEVLERSVSGLTSVEPLHAPWLLQISGMYVWWNVSEPEGKRVVAAYVGNPDSGNQLDRNTYYQVTTPAYLADGGDGYTVFKRGKKRVKTIGRDQIILERYVKEFSPLTVDIVDRLNIVH